MKKSTLFNVVRFIALIVPIMMLPGCALCDWIKELFGIAKTPTELQLAPQVPNTYNGTPITPDSLYLLTSEYAALPSQTHAELNEWLDKSDNKELLKQLMYFKFNDAQAFSKKYSDDNQRIDTAGLQNKSRFNYVFKLPNLDYFIKIAGPSNRAQSALMERGIWPGQHPSQDIFNDVISGAIPTYQTASRAAYYLILKELIKDKDLDHIALQDTHLVYYPGASGKPDDNNVFILEKALPNTVQPLTLERIKTVPQETLEDLVDAIIGAGLWSLEGNMFVDKDGQMLYLIDLEQPNNSAPKDFFHQDPVRYYGNINAGLEQLLDMLQGDADRLRFVRSLIEANPVVQSPEYHGRYKRELVAMLNEKAPKSSE